MLVDAGYMYFAELTTFWCDRWPWFSFWGRECTVSTSCDRDCYVINTNIIAIPSCASNTLKYNLEMKVNNTFAVVLLR